jgi:hypothetical protein
MIEENLNLAPFVENTSTEFVIYASDRKEIEIGEMNNQEKAKKVTIESIKIKCGIPNDWIKMPE